MVSTGVFMILTLFFATAQSETPSEIEMPDIIPFPKEKCDSLLTNCSCYDYETLYGIVCSGMHNFSNFTNLLATGKIFSVYATFEVVLSGIPYIPAKILEGMNVFRLTLDDPNIRTIDESIFAGAKHLRRFHVRRSRIKDIPDFRLVRKSIRSITIENSELISLEEPKLQGLKQIEKLSFYNNSIKYINPKAFKGTDSVVIFDISYNYLEYLPSNLLNPWTMLKVVVLSHNRLLHVDQLFAVAHPRTIFVDYNNITNVDTILYPNMTGLMNAYLAGNPIEETSENSFQGKIPDIRFLYLDHCKIRTLNVSHFRNLPVLSILDFSSNLIEGFSMQKIDMGLDLQLDLNNNKIKLFDAQVQSSVKYLYLTGNKLQRIGNGLQFSKVNEVAINRNQLQYLSVEDFRDAQETINLDLRVNSIKWIDKATFSSVIDNVHFLDLSSNLITSLNGSVKYMSQLKSLNVSFNLIETFEENEFIGLNELSQVYLQYNRIKNLNGQLQLLPNLQYIVITHNNIQSLKLEQIPKITGYLFLAENPLICDCRLLPLLLWLNSSSSTRTDIQLCPPHTNGSLNVDKLNARCPDMCSCKCEGDGDNPFMSLDCSSRHLKTVPSSLIGNNVQMQNTTSIMFDNSLVLDQNTEPYFSIHDKVLSINFANNDLRSLDDVQLPDDLLSLNISNNRLRSLSESVLYKLKNLKTMFLSGNPWACNCNSKNFKKWLLSKMSIVQDINATRCSISKKNESKLDGRVIWTLTDLDLCPVNIGFYIAVAFGILSFLLLGMVAEIAYTRNKTVIKGFLYSHGINWVKQRETEYDKKFDAFISYSHKDEDFVSGQIISGIEKKDPNIRLCIHYKHFTPGEFIYNNIIHSIQDSKRTVLILSRNFLQSEWCRMEFRTAHVQALEDRMHRIIVIKVGELPNEIDPAIKQYLDRTTFLTWGDKYFWNSLMYVLPTSASISSSE